MRIQRLDTEGRPTGEPSVSLPVKSFDFTLSSHDAPALEPIEFRPLSMTWDFKVDLIANGPLRRMFGFSLTKRGRSIARARNRSAAADTRKRRNKHGRVGVR